MGIASFFQWIAFYLNLNCSSPKLTCHNLLKLSLSMKSQVHTPWRMARKRAPSHQRNRAVSLPGVGKSEPKRSSLSRLKVTVGHTFCFPYLEVCNITRNFMKFHCNPEKWNQYQKHPQPPWSRANLFALIDSLGASCSLQLEPNSLVCKDSNEAYTLLSCILTSTGLRESSKISCSTFLGSDKRRPVAFARACTVAVFPRPGGPARFAVLQWSNNPIAGWARLPARQLLAAARHAPNGLKVNASAPDCGSCVKKQLRAV